MVYNKINIHPVHRRMAEMFVSHKNLVNLYEDLSPAEFKEFSECLQANVDLVSICDELNQLIQLAHSVDDQVWKHELYERVKQIEVSFVQ